MGGRQTHGTIPQSTSQQYGVLGLLEPEVVSLCLTALDGFLSSCLLLPLACIYAEEQAQKAVVVPCYTPARRKKKKMGLNLQSQNVSRLFHFQFPL